MWSIMEPAFGIIAACMATFRPLFKNWGFGWTSGKRSGGDSGKSTGEGSHDSSGKRSSIVPWRSASGGKQMSIDLAAAAQPNGRAGDVASPDGSEMELNKRSSTRDDEVEAASPRSWDVERGEPMDHGLLSPQAARKQDGITVRSSVNVSSFPQRAVSGTRPSSRSTEGEGSFALVHPDMPPPPPVSRTGQA